MNVEELLRSSLHSEAGTAAPIDNLLDTSVAKGQRKQKLRRTAAVLGTVCAMAGVGAGAIVVGNFGPGNSQTVTPLSGSGPTTAEPVTPWWQTWTPDRHNGPVDQTFLTKSRPQYDGESAPEEIKVWATGTTPDGTDWAMFTSPTTGHEIQWVMGWDGQPDFGESTQTTNAGLTWDSFVVPTRTSHDNSSLHSSWLIVVGRPGTKEIDYSPDGQEWTALEVHNGIGVLKVPSQYPPATAKVRLGDETDLYATGTPAGAGAGVMAGHDPAATATAAPGNVTADTIPETEPPARSWRTVPISPTPASAH